MSGELIGYSWQYNPELNPLDIWSTWHAAFSNSLEVKLTLPDFFFKNSEAMLHSPVTNSGCFSRPPLPPKTRISSCSPICSSLRKPASIQRWLFQWVASSGHVCLMMSHSIRWFQVLSYQAQEKRRMPALSCRLVSQWEHMAEDPGEFLNARKYWLNTFSALKPVIGMHIIQGNNPYILRQRAIGQIPISIALWIP